MEQTYSKPKRGFPKVAKPWYEEAFSVYFAVKLGSAWSIVILGALVALVIHSFAR